MKRITMPKVQKYTSITLVRHGQTDWNALSGDSLKSFLDLNNDDIKLQIEENLQSHLNEIGKTESIRAADQLKIESFDQVLCSPTQRAKETCAYLLTHHPQINIKYDDRFNETNLRDFLADHELVEMQNINWSNKILEMSFADEVLHRISEKISLFINQIISEYAFQHILIVSHGSLIQHIKFVLEKIYINKNSIHFYPKTKNCQITKYRIDNPNEKAIKLFDSWSFDSL